jgi:hypothetical protein
MLKVQATNPNAETAFYRAMKLAGGQDTYGFSTQASIWAECHNSEMLQRLAGQYLYSQAGGAERSLARLDEKLREVFGI